MKHLNRDLRPLAEGEFPDTGANLFGEDFGKRAKTMADNIRALKGVQYKKPVLFFRVRRLKQEVPRKQAPESPAKLGCPISSKEVCVSEAGRSIQQAATAESEARLPSKTATKVSTHSPPWLEAVRHPPTLSSPNTLHIIKEQEFIPPVPPTTLVGRTATHLVNWTKITSDPWVLETVGGYKLELVDSPFRTNYLSPG